MIRSKRCAFCATIRSPNSEHLFQRSNTISSEISWISWLVPRLVIRSDTLQVKGSRLNLKSSFKPVRSIRVLRSSNLHPDFNPRRKDCPRMVQAMKVASRPSDPFTPLFSQLYLKRYEYHELIPGHKYFKAHLLRCATIRTFPALKFVRSLQLHHPLCLWLFRLSKTAGLTKSTLLHISLPPPILPTSHASSLNMLFVVRAPLGEPCCSLVWYG